MPFTVEIYSPVYGNLLAEGTFRVKNDAIDWTQAKLAELKMPVVPYRTFERIVQGNIISNHGATKIFEKILIIKSQPFRSPMHIYLVEIFDPEDPEKLLFKARGTIIDWLYEWIAEKLLLIPTEKKTPRVDWVFSANTFRELCFPGLRSGVMSLKTQRFAKFIKVQKVSE